jgi:hypothetical protein
MAKQRICDLRIRIDDGETRSMASLGFHLMDSPDVLVPPQREYETERFPESNGAKIYPYTTYEPFDYTCEMLFVGSIDEMNSHIRLLWNQMFEQEPYGHVRRAKRLTLYNDYKGVSIVGYAKEMPGEETFIEITEGFWRFKFTIFVASPQECSWSI